VWTGSTHQRELQVRSDRHVQLLAYYIRDFLNTDPPIEAVRGLRQTRVGPPFEDLRKIRLTTDLVQKLYDKFLDANLLSVEERRDLSWNAAKTIASMALQAGRFNTWGFVLLCMQAVKLDHRLLYPPAIMKGLQRAKLIRR
jgi:hypothetical protein